MTRQETLATPTLTIRTPLACRLWLLNTVTPGRYGSRCCSIVGIALMSAAALSDCPIALGSLTGVGNCFPRLRLGLGTPAGLTFYASATRWELQRVLPEWPRQSVCGKTLGHYRSG